MKKLPESENHFVIRTDFSNQAAWDEICTSIRRPVEEDFWPAWNFVDDVSYENASKKQLLKLFPKESSHIFCIIVDRIAVSQPDHPLLLVDLLDEPGREFRAILSKIDSIDSNLSEVNMGFEDYAEAVGEDGVFRGFPSLPQ